MPRVGVGCGARVESNWDLTSDWFVRPTGILANKLGLTWRTKEGTHKANYFGSITQVRVYVFILDVPTYTPPLLIVDSSDQARSIATPSPNTLPLQASTVRLGNDRFGNSVHVPFSSLLPMVHPNDLVVGGWDISAMSIGACCALGFDSPSI